MSAAMLVAAHAELPGSKVLLDTHVVLWSLADDAQLGPRARSLIEDNTIIKFVSSASIWEMEIKAQLGRLDTPDDIAVVLLASGVQPLPISWFHAKSAGALPRYHGDPFDRMLIAQARCDDLTLISSDSSFEKYDVNVVSASK
jgi:PIN domain nuclease of toxin-antitoxin system